MSYAATALVAGQAKLLAKFASTELRAIDPLTFKAFKKSADIMFPDIATLRTREDRAVTASYFNRQYRAAIAARSSTPTGAIGASSILTPSLATTGDQFRMTMKTGGANVLKYQETMDYQLDNALKNINTNNETLAVNFLYNNRSSVNAGVADGAFVLAKNT